MPTNNIFYVNIFLSSDNNCNIILVLPFYFGISVETVYSISSSVPGLLIARGMHGLGSSATNVAGMVLIIKAL